MNHKKSIAKCIFICILLELLTVIVDIDIFQGVIFGGDYDSYWFFYIYVMKTMICFLLATLFEIIPAKEIQSRSIILLFFIYSVVENQLYLIYNFCGYNVYSAGYFVTFFLMWTAFIFNRFKQYSFKSDSIKNVNYYLCFWKPTTTTTTAWSLIGFPIGGVSIYCPMQWWGFRWRKTTYTTEDYTPRAINRKFILIDTGICSMRGDGEKIKDLLNSLIGTPAGLFRFRCIKTITPVLKMLGKRFIVKNCIELIPSLYFKRICEENEPRN